MSKAEERRILEAVLGSLRPLTVIEREEPDFICIAGKQQFGVEVSEVFFSESDARLHKIPNYVSELVGGGRYRHKDDKVQIRVENIIYRCGADGREFPIKAIPRPVPTLYGALQSVAAVIRAKNVKCSRYHQQVKPVDLVIHDANGMLRYERLSDLLCLALSGETCTILEGSPFREIYLLAGGGSGGQVSIPLRANLFASAVATFGTLFEEYQATIGKSATVGEYLDALATYLSANFQGVQSHADDSRVQFGFASIAYAWKGDGAEIRDISGEDLSDWNPLSTEVKGHLDQSLADFVQDRRNQLFCCYELQFAARQSA